MAADIALWKSDRLTPDERLVIMRNLGFFATAESLVAAVQKIRQDEVRYIRESRELAVEKREQWQASFEVLRSIIAEAAAG